MGGPDAPDHLELGHQTQTWLATSEEPEALVSGRYCHHRETPPPRAEASDPSFQDQLLHKLAELTEVTLF